MTLIADSTDWDESCSCHEIEPLVVDCIGYNTDSVHTALYENRFYIAVLKDNILAYINMFLSNCFEDALYYTLATYKAVGFDRMRHPLTVRGEINKVDFKKYFVRCV